MAGTPLPNIPPPLKDTQAEGTPAITISKYFSH